MKHRLGHRYKGTLRMTFSDGYSEETVVREKESKGYDYFMVRVLEAIVEGSIYGNVAHIDYSGDFIHDVDSLINVLNEIGSDPAKQKKLEEMIKEYKEAKS